MRKIKVCWGSGISEEHDILEFDDNATDEEIEKEAKEYVMDFFEWYWEEVKEDTAD